MFAIGLVLLALGWLMCKVGDNPVVELVYGKATTTKTIGALVFLVGLSLMVASLSLLAWKYMP